MYDTERSFYFEVMESNCCVFTWKKGIKNIKRRVLKKKAEDDGIE